MASNQHLIVLANECPVPAIHGGRIDVLRRLRALKSAGVQVTLIFWKNDRDGGLLSQTDHEQLRELVCHYIALDVRGTKIDLLARIVAAPLYPSHVLARWVSPSVWASVKRALHGRAYDGIVLDGLYGGLLAQRLARWLKVPLLYRSHNIEHVYMHKQAAKAEGWRKKLPIALNLLSLERFERNVFAGSAAFFDISSDDLAWWVKQGYTHGHWMPPIMDARTTEALTPVEGWAPSFDVGYVGNLYSPNNVEGVCWFLQHVMPVLNQARPGIRVFIAGSRPTPQVLHLAQAHGVTVFANPPEMAPIIRDARVLVNPVFAGSGVNIKAVEMLFSPAELVSTSVGVGGLPESVSRHFQVSDEAAGFAAHVLAALGRAIDQDAAERVQARGEARRVFQPESVQVMLDALRHREPNQKAGPACVSG